MLFLFLHSLSMTKTGYTTSHADVERNIKRDFLTLEGNHHWALEQQNQVWCRQFYRVKHIWKTKETCYTFWVSNQYSISEDCLMHKELHVTYIAWICWFNKYIYQFSFSWLLLFSSLDYEEKNLSLQRTTP